MEHSAFQNKKTKYLYGHILVYVELRLRQARRGSCYSRIRILSCVHIVEAGGTGASANDDG
jgi:hypothetical protein